MAKRKKKRETKKPKWVKELARRRGNAIGLTEDWISFQGGDRSLRDPGPKLLYGEPFVDFFEAIVPPDMLRELKSRGAEEYAAIGEHFPTSVGSTQERITSESLVNGALGIHFAVRWANFGMPAFVLDADTAGMLALTDVDKLDLEDVHFPFPSFVLVLEPGSGVTLMARGEKKPEPVALILVHVYERAGMGRILEIVAEGYKGGEQISTFEYPERNAKVSKWVEDQRQGIELGFAAAKRMGVELKTETEEAAMEHVLAVMRTVISFAMLFRTEGASPKPPRHGISRTRWDQSELPLPKDWVVAQIKMPAAVKKAVRETGRVRQGVLTARHVVRGHWKAQSHGPRGSLRKAIRIDPYWRGAGPEALTKTAMPRRKKKNPGSQRTAFRRLMRL